MLQLSDPTTNSAPGAGLISLVWGGGVEAALFILPPEGVDEQLEEDDDAFKAFRVAPSAPSTDAAADAATSAEPAAGSLVTLITVGRLSLAADEGSPVDFAPFAPFAAFAAFDLSSVVEFSRGREICVFSLLRLLSLPLSSLFSPITPVRRQEHFFGRFDAGIDDDDEEDDVDDLLDLADWHRLFVLASLFCSACYMAGKRQ